MVLTESVRRSAKRVVPADLVESSKVTVSGADGEAVLDRERGELGVGYEIAGDTVADAKVTEDPGGAF
jgi:hypothetical protein